MRCAGIPSLESRETERDVARHVVGWFGVRPHYFLYFKEQGKKTTEREKAIPAMIDKDTIGLCYIPNCEPPFAHFAFALISSSPETRSSPVLSYQGVLCPDRSIKVVDHGAACGSALHLLFAERPINLQCNEIYKNV